MKAKFLMYAMVTVVFLQSCTKSSDIRTNDDAFYFTGTINSQNITYTATETGDYGCGVSSPGQDYGDQHDVYNGTLIEKMTDDKNSIYVHILKRFSGSFPTKEEMLPMFHTGSYNYGYSHPGGTTINGASIVYIDNNGVYWASEGGPQAGSTFSIDKLTDSNDGTCKKVFEATFSCKLYNGSNSITLSNGKVRGKAFFP